MKKTVSLKDRQDKWWEEQFRLAEHSRGPYRSLKTSDLAWQIGVHPSTVLKYLHDMAAWGVVNRWMGGGNEYHWEFVTEELRLARQAREKLAEEQKAEHAALRKELKSLRIKTVGSHFETHKIILDLPTARKLVKRLKRNKKGSK